MSQVYVLYYSPEIIQINLVVDFEHGLRIEAWKLKG